MKTSSSIIILVFGSFLGIFSSVFAQQHTDNKADQTLRGSGRVNASTLGMEIDIPLGSYPGRGINVPISLSYSSKLWRTEYINSQPRVNNPADCIALNIPKYADNSASGWTTSMAAPYIEYSGKDNLFNDSGFPLSDPCSETPNNQGAYVKRLTVHLPGGETHELRANDTITVYNRGTNPQFDFNATFYATDGSNIKYVENSSNGTYKLLMPDGSYYEFNGATTSYNSATIRKANKFTDRNGNFTSYNEPTTAYPNGYWTDTLGKIIAVPFGLSAPTAPNIQTYSMPGMTETYKFHWKQLKGGTTSDSAITEINYSQALKYMADRASGNPNGTPRASGTYLFGSGWEEWVHDASAPLFNPVVLAEIELPTGQKYKFTYDFHGRIERIYYPTGGEERFEYGGAPQLSYSQPGDINAQTNFGVAKRQVFTTAGQGTPLEWLYSFAEVLPSGVKIATTAPDLTKTERYLHRNLDSAGVGTFDYDTALAGMAYEERAYDNSNPNKLVSKKLTSWAVTSLTTSGGLTARAAHWHPRVAQEESIIYDALGNGVSATTKYEYEDEANLILRETPVLMKKSLQYAFVAAGSLPPQTPVRTVETTFLINDLNIPQTDRDVYKNQNMIGLATASVVKDSAGTVVSRSEMKYDEAVYSPTVGRGNPTSARAWDSTKGTWDNSGAYLQTRAKFDAWGNQTESTDAKGSTIITEYDATHRAFPIKVTTPIPDATGAKGSNQAFVTEATYDTTTGLPLTTKDVNGQITTMQYDPVTLRPKKVIPPSGAGEAETFYNDVPNDYWVKTKTQIDTDKWAESITHYDGLGRAYKAEQVNSQGNIFVEKEFDADGRVSRVSNPYRSGETKKWTTNVYDEASRIKQVTLQDGATIKTDYGVSTTTGLVGVTKQITDQAGKKRKGITDALGRMIRVIEDPTGQNLPTDYVFDTLGNLRKTTQGDQLRYFSYDSLGRLLRAKQPEQEVNTNLALPTADPVTGHNAWSVKYEYDDTGNITKTTDARGVYIQGTYDKFNRLIFRDYSDTATPDVHFYYDGTGLPAVPNYSKGKTTRAASSVSETRYTAFDNLGRLLSSEQKTPFDTESAEAAAPKTSSYKYNLAGMVIEETYPSTRVVKHVLDENGRLAMLQSKKNANAGFWNYATNITYNTAGAVTKMQLGNGRWETAVFNDRLQITQIGLGTTDAVQNLLKLEYSYGSNTQNNGSLREQKITVPTAGSSSPGFTAVQTYAYDDLNRLQSVDEKPLSYDQTQCNANPSQCWKQTFLYDRYGNREFNTAAGATTTLNPAVADKVKNPQINTSDNRFQKDQDGDTQTDYDYDKTGNLIRDAVGWQFFYDAENHQKEVKNASGVSVGTYLYDGEGKRVKKITATETTVFVYNASKQLVAEYSTQVAPASTAQVSYLTTDHLGSPRIITGKDGAVLKRQDYSAFGEETYLAQRTANAEYMGQTGENQPTRKGYTGYEKDGESELEFAQARYYNSSHGRFTSVDPLTASASIRDPQTFNRYSYVLNSPYKFTDPLGLISSSTGACGQFCANSGPTVDGSAFRGRDASFDWSQQRQDKPKPSFGAYIPDIDRSLFPAERRGRGEPNGEGFADRSNSPKLDGASLELEADLGNINESIEVEDGKEYTVGFGGKFTAIFRDKDSNAIISDYSYTLKMEIDGFEFYTNIIKKAPVNGIIQLPSLLLDGQQGLVGLYDPIPLYEPGDIIQDRTRTYKGTLTFHGGFLGSAILDTRIEFTATASRVNGSYLKPTLTIVSGKLPVLPK